MGDEERRRSAVMDYVFVWGAVSIVMMLAASRRGPLTVLILAAVIYFMRPNDVTQGVLPRNGDGAGTSRPVAQQPEADEPRRQIIRKGE